MKLFILNRLEKCKWDESNAFIIRAKSEKEARNLASINAGDEGKETWLNVNKTSCSIVSIDGKSEILIKDFHDG